MADGLNILPNTDTFVCDDANRVTTIASLQDGQINKKISSVHYMQMDRFLEYRMHTFLFLDINPLSGSALTP
jgi:hypothetical protein